MLPPLRTLKAIAMPYLRSRLGAVWIMGAGPRRGDERMSGQRSFHKLLRSGSKSERRTESADQRDDTRAVSLSRAPTFLALVHPSLPD
jgi:hypothetical protein